MVQDSVLLLSIQSWAQCDISPISSDSWTVVYTDSEWSADGYFAICVPYVQTASQKIFENPSDAPSLVRISIYCAHNHRRDWSKPVHFAKKVSPKEIQSWADHGWVNQFLD